MKPILAHYILTFEYISPVKVLHICDISVYLSVSHILHIPFVYSTRTVSQKTSKIIFVITTSNLHQIWQFLAQLWQIVWNYMRCTHFPPHLTHGGLEAWRSYNENNFACFFETRYISELVRKYIFFREVTVTLLNDSMILRSRSLGTKIM